MSEKVSLLNLLKRRPFNIISIFLVLGILAIGVVALSGGRIASDKISRVEIESGGRSITVNENGLVEITTEAGTTYSSLDSQKLSNLFNYIKKKAAGPQKLSADSPGNIIAITLVIDGEEITIYIDADDPEFQDIINEILEGSGGGEDISDYFDGDGDTGQGDEDGSDGQGFFDTIPTPTQGVSAPSPTGGVCPNLYLPPGVADPGGDCTSWNEDITGKAVISNTVCFEE